MIDLNLIIMLNLQELSSLPRSPHPSLFVLLIIVIGDSGIVPIVIKENMKEGRNHL